MSRVRRLVLRRSLISTYLLPKLEETARNGWPDWAVLWSDRKWVIELKTEAASHRYGQLPYYLLLATAAHPRCSLDVDVDRIPDRALHLDV